jgi:hypothetical protein
MYVESSDRPRDANNSFCGKQSCLLIIDTIIQSAVVSPKGSDLVDSLTTLNKNVYQPVPPPPFVPVDFGEASRIQHQINVALTALCNCK